MGAPLPLEGSNPYTGMYQERQFGVGYPYTPTSQQQVAGYLANPPSNLVTAEEQTPLVEEAEFFGLYVQTITVTGSPSSGTFVLQYGVYFTSSLSISSTASTIQTALRGLTSIGGSNVSVTGSAGGPWTATFSGAFADEPVSLIGVRSTNLVGGTAPDVVVTSTAEQEGIIPF
jgi:hypothetical protein